MYSPPLGRWLSPDPLNTDTSVLYDNNKFGAMLDRMQAQYGYRTDAYGFNPDPSNSYRYVFNNPVISTDATGLVTGVEEGLIITTTTSGAGLGGAVVVGAFPGVALGGAIYYFGTGPLLEPGLTELFCEAVARTRTNKKQRKKNYTCTTKARNWGVGTPCYGQIFTADADDYQTAKDLAEEACQDAGCHQPGNGGDCGHTTCRQNP